MDERMSGWMDHHKAAPSFAVPNSVANTQVFVSNALALSTIFWVRSVLSRRGEELVRSTDGG